MRSLMLVTFVFLGFLWWGMPVSAQTCNGGNGVCTDVLECPGYYTVDIACNGTVCCLNGNSNPQPPAGPVACTSDDSGNVGVCRDTCQNTEQAETASDTCGRSNGYCCVTYANTDPINYGAACTNASGAVGSCIAQAGLCSGGTKYNSSAIEAACGPGGACCVYASGGGSVVDSGSCPATACSATACVLPLANDNTKTSTTCPYCCVSSGVGPGPGGPGPGTNNSNCSDPNRFEKIAGVCFPKSSSIGLSDKSVLDILESLVTWILAIFGFIAILGFIISGIQYLLSAGDEGQAETAKRNMQYSIIGIIVALSGWIIIQAVDALLNARTLA